ncbi:C-type lectin domain family 17, member A isoform X2 [Nycticebus coucang]|uniref:C-type lectin domain family 17, member A isoform X2 n=1 Tax=Nycticebus coucang TaxID=9470 RepID=UPI00234C4FEB|nr:C-type lectin domain family 17, member A isoform X2 [Nycticebus coucang]
MYTNSACPDPLGYMEEEDDDDYENTAPPYKDLPPKPGSVGEDDDDDYENTATPYKDLPPKPGLIVPPRPPRAEKKSENPPLPCKPPKTTGLDLTPVPCVPSQLGINLEPPPFQPSLAATPVPWLSQKSGSPGYCQEERLMVYLCVLVVVSLLLGCVSLTVTLIKYQEVMEELRMLTFQQMVWQANVTGMAGLAGLRKDIDRVRAGTNQSLVELQGLLECTRVTCPEGWVPFEGKCYYFSPSTKSWDEARKFCQENYSHLVIISNFAEQNFVAKAHRSPRVYWLGLHDKHKEGDWRWLDGSPVTLSFWDPEEPNNMNEEDCASMNKGGSWNDLSCDKTTYWICERKCSC